MPQFGSDNTLPSPLTSLIGREQDVATLRHLLTQDNNPIRLLTLTGAAGSGKTRLAIRLGAVLSRTYPDAVGWVDLSLVVDERLIGQAVANALQIATNPKEEVTTTLVKYLESRHLLLMIDNCEHLIDGCADLVQRLLSGCPHLQILATSRESLKIPGETIWLTPLLSVPRRGTEPPFAELLDYPGIRLWIERATAAFPQFRLTPENAPAVVRVCQRLDGMPLAIELAAARVKVLSVEQIAARLDDRFRLLKADMRTVLPRNQTLRATIDWSYALLSAAERELLQCLSVFVGGCTLDAVEYLVADESAFVDDTALDVLTRLVEKSLVVVEQRDGQGARYTLLETIRQYGLEKLQSPGHKASVRRRHRDWLLQRAESIFPRIGNEQQNSWLAEMDAEYENFQAAIEWSAQEAGEAGHGLRLACLMRHYWDRKGYVHEARFYLPKLLAHPENSAPSATRAEALNYLGFFTLLHGDAATATTFYADALAIGEALKDLSAIALACSGLVFVLAGSGDPHEAEPYIRRGLDAARQINDPVRIYNLLFYASWLALAQGDYPRSHSLLEESLRLMQAGKDLNLMAAALWRLGHLCWLEGRYSHSLAAFQESLVVRRSLNNLRGVAYAIDGVAWVAAAAGDHHPAARLFGAADRQFSTMQTHFHPLEQPAHNAAVELVRTGLGATAFAADWEEGKHWGLEDAAEIALSLTVGPEPTVSSVMPAAASVPLKLYALGPVRVVLDGRAITTSDWTYSKARELLFYLATVGTASREEIGLVFWPDASPEQLRRNLGVTLHHLRRALGRNEWVIFDKEKYHFNRSLGYWYDAEEFTAIQHNTDSIPHIQQALALYQGDFLADANPGEWYLPLRERLAQQFVELLFALAQRHWDGKDYQAAAALYRRAISHNPYLEAAYRELMGCLAQMGERAQALRVYTELARTIKKEFAALPSPETQALYERLRAG